ncbi:hypothetical protein PAXRUDRAFT_137014 [Paxillus rubicundulus Ve08.2h10]|uniref:F-box domain-containing protein n=1 Tax=Paxillus rubicundulus Ve08.2h10 TaxID=930991 RepID=A0A0D0DGK7_9AGAM|nr:hypothetical protein PAXRUDRAFT_137014 [Paxillus rubicundulus Ve08.2h10]
MCLPPEIISHIMRHLGPSDLAASAALNSHSRPIAERILYREPDPPSSRVIPCVNTLIARPDLASITRRFTIHDPSRTSEALNNYPSLASSALHSMSALTDLTLLLNGSYAKLFHGCPFRLHSLSTTLTWDEDFVKWMEEQTELTNAMFGGPFITGTVLPMSALPKLSQVSATPLILASTVPGRPICLVEICLLQPELMKEDILWTTTRILSFSTGPLNSLQIIANIENKSDALAALNAIPKNIPKLDSFALYAGHGSVTLAFLGTLTTFVSGFEYLKSMMVMSRDVDNVLSDDSVIREVISTWHSSCPTLECVSFLGSVFVHITPHGWLTMDDIERILHDRSGKLAERERKLCHSSQEGHDQEAKEQAKMESQILALRAGLITFGAASQ